MYAFTDTKMSGDDERREIQVYVSNATFDFKTLQYFGAFYIEIQFFM